MSALQKIYSNQIALHGLGYVEIQGYAGRKLVCEILLSQVCYGYAAQTFGSRFRGNDSD